VAYMTQKVQCEIEGLAVVRDYSLLLESETWESKQSPITVPTEESGKERALRMEIEACADGPLSASLLEMYRVGSRRTYGFQPARLAVAPVAAPVTIRHQCLLCQLCSSAVFSSANLSPPSPSFPTSFYLARGRTAPTARITGPPVFREQTICDRLMPTSSSSPATAGPPQITCASLCRLPRTKPPRTLSRPRPRV